MEKVMSLRLVPISIKDANLFVAHYHRHHKPVVGAKFAISVAIDEEIKGVAIVGRPVSRHLDDGWTLEVNRCCTDGYKNACSMLYSASWKVAKAMGYLRLITYTLPQEGGASLRGTGWTLIGKRGGGNWNVPSRPRLDSTVTGQKLLWEVANV